MKTLHVIPAVAPYYGGPSRAIYDMCSALRLVGCEVQIATTDADGEGRLPVRLGEVQLYQGVPTIFFKRQWSESFKFSQPLASWLYGHVKDFDVVHIHAVFSHACLVAARACRNAGVPYIVRTIGNLDPWSLGQKQFRKKLFWHLAVKRMLQGAAAVHYTTQDEKRLAETALGLQRGVVIPLGVDNELLQVDSHKNLFLDKFPVLKQHPYILTLCRLHPKKNLEILINVFLDLTSQNEFQDWKLVIAGDGEADYVARLRNLVQQREAIDHVLLVGWLQGEEKQGALRGAGLFALPSHQENFGLSVVEAMACGVPVFISEQVNLADEVTKAGAGWAVKLADTYLHKTLLEALRNKQKRIASGNAARQLVRERFTWPAVANELMALYCEMSASTELRFAQAI